MSQETEVEYVLKDASDKVGLIPVTVVAERDNLGICIKARGYGTMECEDSGPIFIELYEGNLRIIVWENINSAEPSIITLDRAKECLRNDTVLTVEFAFRPNERKIVDLVGIGHNPKFTNKHTHFELKFELPKRIAEEACSRLADAEFVSRFSISPMESE